MIAKNRNKALKWGVSNEQVFYSTRNTVESQFLEPITQTKGYFPPFSHNDFAPDFVNKPITTKAKTSPCAKPFIWKRV